MMLTAKEARWLTKKASVVPNIIEYLDRLIRNAVKDGNLECIYDGPNSSLMGMAVSLHENEILNILKENGYKAEVEHTEDNIKITIGWI